MEGDQTSRSHENGGPVYSNISEGLAYTLRANRTESRIAFDAAQITSAENRVNPFAGERMTAHTLTSEGADASEDGTGRGTPLISLAVAGDFGAGENVAQTIRGAHGEPGCVTAGLAVRRLTPTECERLQGFEDGWTAGQSDSARYRQLGNSVAVPVIEWIIPRVLAVEAAEGAAHAA